MKSEQCPICRTNVSIMDEVCPKCGEMLFHDTIESTTNIEKNKKNIIFGKKNLKEGIVKKSSFELGRKLYLKIKDKLLIVIKKTRIYKLEAFCTYVNVLGILILIFTVMTIFSGMKLVKYRDVSSTLSKVTATTTFEEIKQQQENKNKKDYKQKLDLQRRVIINSYKEVLGGVKCTVDYERNPSSENITQTVIMFEHNDKNVKNMRRYLEYNYGIGKVLENGTISFDSEQIRYTFTNGTAVKNEKVQIVYH